MVPFTGCPDPPNGISAENPVAMPASARAATGSWIDAAHHSPDADALIAMHLTHPRAPTHRERIREWL